MKNFGWRFFYKNQRPELYFLKTGAYLYFLFFIFLMTEMFLLKTDQKTFMGLTNVLERVWIFKIEKRNITTIQNLFLV